MRLLPRTFFPSHDRNRMMREGDVASARADFIAHRNLNLWTLLRQRYQWMNDFIEDNDVVVELGCGAGLTSFFLRRGTYFGTDVSPSPWLSACVDALRLPFRADSVDVFICVNVIHHLAAPVFFIDRVQDCLRPGGRLLVHEPHPSLLMRSMLRLMNHEGWSFDVDPFDPLSIANDPSDAWSGNNAVSQLVFSDPRFGARFPRLRIVRDRYTECTLFPLSGGVTAKTWAMQLPGPVLEAIARFDDILCTVAPGLLAMGRSIALRKETA